MSSTSGTPEEAITGLITSDVTEKAMGDHTMSDTTAEAGPELSSKEIWESSLRDVPHHQFRSLSKLVRSITKRAQDPNSSKDAQEQRVWMNLKIINLRGMEKAFFKVTVSEGELGNVQATKYYFLEDLRSGPQTPITLDTASPLPAQHYWDSKQLANARFDISKPLSPNGSTPIAEPRIRNGPSVYHTNGLVLIADEPAGEVFSFTNRDVVRLGYSFADESLAVRLRDGTSLAITLENERDAAAVADHILWSMIGPRK